MKKKLLSFCLLLIGTIPNNFLLSLANILSYCFRLSKTFKTTHLNIKIAFPTLNIKQQLNLSKRSLTHTLYTFLEICSVWYSSKKQIQKSILQIEGESILDKLIQQNTPIIIVAPHLGCWEMISYWLKFKGHNMMIMYQPSRFSYVTELMIERRTRFGNQIVPNNQTGIKKLLLTLKSNHFIGILPDQVPPKDSDSIDADFFGTNARTMTLIYKMMKRTEATPVFIAALRVKGKGYKIVVQEFEKLSECTNKKIFVTLLNQGIERLILLAPEQYQWSYKRYRYNPAIDYKKFQINQ